MEKITKEKIQSLIPIWLGTDKLKDIIKDRVEYTFEGAKEDDNLQGCIEEIINEQNLPKESSTNDIIEYYWNLWKDGQQWEEGEEKYIDEDTIEYENPIPDVAGEYNTDLVKRLLESKQNDKVVNWTFVPKNEDYADTYRLEVILTPDETEIVGWQIIQD